MRNDFFGSRKGYIVENGKLVAIEIMGATIEVGGRLTIDANIGGERATRAYEVEEELPPLYASEKDYIDKKVISTSEIWYYDALGECERNTETAYLVSGCKVEGVSVSSLRWTLDDKFTCDSEVYWSEKAANASTDLEVIESDGTSHTRRGAKSLLALNDEQNSAVDEFLSAYKRLQDLGVCVAANTENDYMVAYNARGIRCNWDEPTDDYPDLLAFGRHINNYMQTFHGYWGIVGVTEKD